jgi:uncharacterized OB-fold protein
LTEDAAQLYHDRPRPLADHVSQPYWDGLADGELRYQYCDGCRKAQFYPRAWCSSCGADTAWQVADGTGAVHTYTVIRHNGAPPFRDQVPYVVAMIDVSPGFRMMGNVIDVEPAAVHIGMAVRARIVAVDDGYNVLVWHPERPTRSTP